MGRQTWLALAALQAPLLSVLGAVAYYEIFSQHQTYDDEGYMMLTVRHVLDGRRLYDDVWTLYGPVYFFYKWTLHGLLALPLTHDVVRIAATAMRLATGVAASVAVVGLTGSVALAVVAQVLVTGHLVAICNEPGHPQELAGLLVMVAVATAAVVRASRARTALVALGLEVAALTMVKVNLGILAGLAVAMAAVALLRPTAIAIAVRALAVIAAIALPWALMRATLARPFVWQLAATATATLLATGVVTFRGRGGQLRGRDVLCFVGAVAAGLALVALATRAAGSTFVGLLDGVLLSPMRLPGVYVWAPEWSPWRPGYALTAIALAAVVAGFAGTRTMVPLLVAAKAAFGVFTVTAAWRLDLPFLLGALTPFCWLVLPLADAGRPRPAAQDLARHTLCWLAVLQPLQAYPVAGSQVSFATVLLSVCGVVCLGDALGWLAARSTLLARPALRTAVASAILVTVIGERVRAVQHLQQTYASLVPLGLPGTERLRLPQPEVDAYRSLVVALRQRADAFLCVPGFNSLYFWTGMAPPTLDVIGQDIGFYPESRQVAMLSALLAHERPIVVRFMGLVLFSPAFDALVGRSFERVATVGRYRLMGRKPGARSPGERPPPLRT